MSTLPLTGGWKQGHVLLPDSGELHGPPPSFSKSSYVTSMRSEKLSLLVIFFIRDMTFLSIVGLFRGVFPADTQPRSSLDAVAPPVGVVAGFFRAEDFLEP